MLPSTEIYATVSCQPNKNRLRYFASRGDAIVTPQMSKQRNPKQACRRLPRRILGYDRKGEVPKKNFFVPLRTAEMDVERTLVEGTSEEPNRELQQPASSKAGRPPPIVLTSTTNLKKLQRHIRDIVTGYFEFRNTRSGARIVTKEMADFSAIRKHLGNNNLSYYTFSQNQRNLSRP
jgi:hypothetical protein